MPAVVNDRCLHLKVVDVPVVLVVQAPQLHVETAVITQLQVVEHSSLYGGGGEDVVVLVVRTRCCNGGGAETGKGHCGARTA